MFTNARLSVHGNFRLVSCPILHLIPSEFYNIRFVKAEIYQCPANSRLIKKEMFCGCCCFGSGRQPTGWEELNSLFPCCALLLLFSLSISSFWNNVVAWNVLHYTLYSVCLSYPTIYIVPYRRIVSSGMLRHVTLARTYVSEELSASFIRVTRIGELGTTLALSSILRSVRRLLVTASVVPSSPILIFLMKGALSSSETLVLTRATRCNIPEDTILHGHRRENLKSYISLTGWVLQQRCKVSPMRYELDFISQKTAFFIVNTVKTTNLT
jgi:hypothetical protein